MRNITGLSTDVLNRAVSLSARARDTRAAVPGLSAPQNTISPARVVDGVATLRLYDYIDPDGGYWGISALEFAEALDEAGPVSRIDLRINSGGGSVWDGLAMINTLRDHDATVRAYVDGIAASAASFIAAACDETVMMPNSRMMIHDALGLCIGQAVDMRDYAAFLEDTSANIAEIYAEASGKPVAEWKALMSANGLRGTWYSAQEAVDAGIADKVGAQADDGDPEDKTPPAPKMAACGCGPELDGMEHKNECPTKAAPAATDHRARFEAKRHELNAARHGLSA